MLQNKRWPLPLCNQATASGLFFEPPSLLQSKRPTLPLCYRRRARYVVAQRQTRSHRFCIIIASCCCHDRIIVVASLSYQHLISQLCLFCSTRTGASLRVLLQSTRPCRGRRPNGCEEDQINAAASASCVIGSSAFFDHMLACVESANLPKQEIVQPGSQMSQNSFSQKWSASFRILLNMPVNFMPCAPISML